jgi:hypothetical protein
MGTRSLVERVMDLELLVAALAETLRSHMTEVVEVVEVPKIKRRVKRSRRGFVKKDV